MVPNGISFLPHNLGPEQKESTSFLVLSSKRHVLILRGLMGALS